MINVLVLPQALLLSAHQSGNEILWLPLWLVVLAISISLVIAIFVTTRNDCPPKWHIAFSAGSFAGSILVIYNVAKEVVSVMTAVGIISDMSDSMVGLSILAWGNSIGDAFSNVSLAKQGYQQMAIAACFGGPMFSE
jgi:solute carrier family 24 (sodium/potassium/calcium exchanger), member 6